MIDYKKFRQIASEIGTIFEKYKLTNGDVIKILNLYLEVMNKVVEEE